MAHSIFRRLFKSDKERAARFAEQQKAERERHPLDHDGNGKKGGSPKPKPSAELTAARKEYRAKSGKQAFHGWDEAELRRRIDALS
jgi:hypothetical protein